MKRLTIVTLMVVFASAHYISGMNNETNTGSPAKKVEINHLAKQIFSHYSHNHADKRDKAQEQFTSARGDTRKLNALRNALGSRYCNASHEDKETYRSLIMGLYPNTPPQSPAPTLKNNPSTPTSPAAAPIISPTASPAPAPSSTTPEADIPLVPGSDIVKPTEDTLHKIDDTLKAPSSDTDTVDNTIDPNKLTTKATTADTPTKKIFTKKLMTPTVIIGTAVLVSFVGGITYWYKKQKTKKADDIDDIDLNNEDIIFIQ